MTRTASTGFGFDRAALVASLNAVGIGSGDLVYFQACAEHRDGGTEDQHGSRAFCELLWGGLTEAVGTQGTIIVPTYTFSFCRNETFDADRSPTVWGLWNTFPEFPEFVRHLPGAVRSLDPIFSNAGVGPQARELLSNLPHTCLGEDSVHDRIRRHGGKICLLGVGLHEAIFRHYVEAVCRVPWRYDKLFTGTVCERGATRREGWVYNVRIQSSHGDPAGQRLEVDAHQTGIARAAPAGTSELVAVNSTDFFELTSDSLSRDPWYTARGPAGDPVQLEAARVGAPTPAVELPPEASPTEVIDGLWQLRRDIVSDGYDAALDALAAQVPMRIHEYPTGTPCWTWIVPEKWTCHEAFLETLDGRRLFSYAEHPLHVVSYSLPIERVVSREELFAHLHVHPRLPNAVPFVFKYYDRDWGVCCSQEQKRALTDDQYRIVIRSSFSYGTLKVGEVVAPGASKDSIVLCAHLCHPGMVNDDLTGVAVGLDVIRRLLARRDLRYTYRLLITPETIGSVAFLSHQETLIPHLKGGVFLEMLGKSDPHALQLSFAGDTFMDRCSRSALSRHDPQGWTSAFRSIIGNDERQFNAPGVRVPMVSLSRVRRPEDPQYPYREYHSSEDTPAIVSAANLAQSRDLVLGMIDAIEAELVPVNDFVGEVFCTRYGIHRDWYQDPAGNRALFDMMFLIDGTRSISAIAEACGISVDVARAGVGELVRRGLAHYR